MLSDPLMDKLVDFVRGIGIEVRSGSLEPPTFLPGLGVRHGALLIDPSNLAYPGDILHEAGHIAVSPPGARNKSTLAPSDGDELAAIAWSYAAARTLAIDPAIVFHQGGYRGWGSTLVENFNAGHYIGVPLLQWYGMTIEPRRGKSTETQPYPHMLRWLR
jgi:hypothetical protein